jgi:hypothetical protein
MPLVVQAVLVIGYVLTQMLAVAIGGGVVMVLTTVIIGMMTIGMITICTATAMRAKMKIFEGDPEWAEGHFFFWRRGFGPLRVNHFLPLLTQLKLIRIMVSIIKLV